MSAPLRLVEDGRGGPARFHGMIGKHRDMLALYEDIRHAAPLGVPVLVEGPTGSGKELVARALHALSGRPGPLVAVNVSELAEPLVESELFGAIRGAFTGAVSDRGGLLESAAHGTLFLDEAGDLSSQLQAKLLRVLETERVRRLGTAVERHVSFRLLVSVQRPAADLLAEGRWRQDFYYRVAGVRLRIPGLAQRASDIPALATHFLSQLNHPALDEAEFGPLLRHAWPGNVRELRRVLERAVHRARGRVVRAHDLVGAIDACETAPATGQKAPDKPQSLRDVERAHIQAVLNQVGGDARAAAVMLGLSKSSLYRRLESLGIQSERRR